MNKEIKIFNNDKFGLVRTVTLKDEPWFVAADVARILGYTNPNEAVADHVDSDDKFLRGERGSEMLKLFSSVKEMQKELGRQDNWFINESGIYSLVFGSKLPSAKEFKHWVTHEVLPTIRKHGAYATPDTLDKMIASPEFGIKLLTALKEEQEKNGKLTEELDAAQPSIVFAKAVSASDTSILIGGLAKLIKQNGINIGQKRLFQWMRDKGYLIKAGNDKNIPTQRSMEMGLFEVKEGSYVDSDGVNRTTRTTKVTGKGQIYFINKFMENNRVMNKEEAHA